MNSAAHGSGWPALRLGICLYDTGDLGLHGAKNKAKITRQVFRNKYRMSSSESLLDVCLCVHMCVCVCDHFCFFLSIALWDSNIVRVKNGNFKPGGQGRGINLEGRSGSSFICVCVYVCTFACVLMCVCPCACTCVESTCMEKAPVCEPLGLSGRNRGRPTEGSWFG